MMTLTVTDDAMSGDATRHYAVRLDIPTREVWMVSWLPERDLTRNQAITAMTIAETVGGVPAEGDPADYYTPDRWALLDSLAAELSMSGPAAVAQASDPPKEG